MINPVSFSGLHGLSFDVNKTNLSEFVNNYNEKGKIVDTLSKTFEKINKISGDKDVFMNSKVINRNLFMIFSDIEDINIAMFRIPMPKNKSSIKTMKQLGKVPEDFKIAFENLYETKKSKNNLDKIIDKFA